MMLTKNIFALVVTLSLLGSTLATADDEISTEYADRYANQYDLLRNQEAADEEVDRQREEVAAFDREVAKHAKKMGKPSRKPAMKGKSKAALKPSKNKKTAAAKNSKKQWASKKHSAKRGLASTATPTQGQNISTASASSPVDFSATLQTGWKKLKTWMSQR